MTTKIHYDPLLHTKVTTVTQRRHSIYRVLSQHIPTREIIEAYRTPTDHPFPILHRPRPATAGVFLFPP